MNEDTETNTDELVTVPFRLLPYELQKKLVSVEHEISRIVARLREGYFTIHSFQVEVSKNLEIAQALNKYRGYPVKVSVNKDLAPDVIRVLALVGKEQ